MERGEASRLAQFLRMDDHDRISQASSVATISYFPVIKQESSGKVQTFGKRCQAAKRDPNCPVVIRGWLNKKDSSGLKLWKRRWFVLSNYCLFYYKDSREETVMGSIPLPSYKILFCTPRECKNRKFTFKVVHQGMRSYFFSADTQEDMLGWVRALSQSASMETDGSLNRRCSSYQDFTKIGSSSESVDLTRPTSDREGPALKHRHISRTLSEPSHLTGGRMGTTHSEHRGRQTARQRSSRTPSPADFTRRRACGPDLEDILPGPNTPPAQAEMMGHGSLTPRGQLGSRPHTPVGRVDIRPHDDLGPQTLYYTPASPKLESSVTPGTPVTERWQNLNKPSATYGSVHHSSSGRRPLAKSFSTGAHADLLPPLPPSLRATHNPSPTHHHHHHQRSSLSVCVLPPAMSPKIDQREIPSVRPLESDADTVLTRLCGCDKLLQSLSVELAQLQMDKDGVQCALEVSRLQLEKWKNPEPRAQEEALAQKALLQEELVTIRARMCDVSLEMERVWSQYERMESELSVIRSHLQHICNFGMPQEHCQAQRELWMMEDILAGLKINRDHFCFLLGLQRHHRFYRTTPHPGSRVSPTERLPAGLPMDEEPDPPVRPPLPLELLEKNLDHVLMESPYEGIYSHADDNRRANVQPDLPNVKVQKDKFEPQSSLKWTPSESRSQSNKKIRMSEEEQIERMKRNQERLANKKKPCLSSLGSQRLSQGAETREEPPFPLRVTRVVTAVLPSSLVARRVSVEDPPPELSNPLPEQIQADVLQRPSEQSKRTYNKPPRRLLLESPDQIQPSAEMHPDQPVTKANRPQSTQAMKKSWPGGRRAEPLETSRTRAAVARTEEQPPASLTPDVDADLCLTAEQRQAKLRRVERIRERVMKSAVRESGSANDQHPTRGERKDAQVPSDSNRKECPKADFEPQPRSCESSISVLTEPHLSCGTAEEMDETDRTKKNCKNPNRFGSKTQLKDQTDRKGHFKRPDSPYHVSSMMVYQKGGGKGFTVCKNEDEQKPKGPAADNDVANDLATCDVRAKWFLSTNHWQGFIPLPCKDPPSDSIKFKDNLTDSGEMSPAVSESLEKMKDNYSLFYKIACDISISDTDIAKNDGQTSPGPEEKEPLIITEAEEETNQGSSQGDKNVLKGLTPETQGQPASSTSASPAKEDGLPDGTPQNGNEDIICPKDPKLRESPPRSSGQVTNGDHCLDGKAHLEGEDSKANKLKTSSSSLDGEQKDKVQERERSLTRPSSACEAGSATRSASLGKARVTVLRTSF